MAKSSKEEELERKKKRQEKMMKEKCRRSALMKRAVKEKEQLSKLHLITSSDEMKTVLSDIEGENTSCVKKAQKKRQIIKEQINIRKKVFNEKINVPFSKNGKQRPLTVIIKEFMEYLHSDSEASASSCTFSSDSLVGRKVLHKFEVDGEEQWFSGVVISYNAITKLHKIAYDDEKEHCFFNLLEDISQGDLIVTND